MKIGAIKSGPPPTEHQREPRHAGRARWKTTASNGLFAVACTLFGVIRAATLPITAPIQPACTDNPGHNFSIPAWAFDRGNARVYTSDWADGGPMVAFGGESPVEVEYDLEFPVSANYRLRLQYAAAEARPVLLKLDGRALTNVCRHVTGSWNTSGGGWEESATLPIPAGKHTLRLERRESFPHLMSLRFDASVRLPDGWVVNRPKARKLQDPAPGPTVRLWEPPVDLPALRRALEDLVRNSGATYPNGSAYLDRLANLEREAASGHDIAAEFRRLQREALLANPLLDFQDLLLVRRPANSPSIGLPRNWESNCSLPGRGYDDALCTAAFKDETSPLQEIYRPGKKFLGDVDLHWDGQKVLYSSIGKNGRWQVFELDLQPGATPRELTGEEPDVDSYDACYLPNDRIIFTSTASFVGVPCVNGSAHVANLYVMDSQGGHIRQLAFDQEHNWCPTVMNDGRLLYSRWEYTDTPHSNTRLLFTMNPDGTSQLAYLGSGSYWPNSYFYTRPIPDHPTMVVSVIGGHHDHPRMGELVLFDPQLGRFEGEPTVQRIPGYGRKVEPLIRDGLTLDSWPKFLHPWPLSAKYFLVACKPRPSAPWGLYLTDVFDNLVPLRQLDSDALLEPIPRKAHARPPVIPDRVQTNRTDALVVIQDIYAGEGLRGVPRGTVKSLRLFTYHYAYQEMGGLLGVVGMDGPWDIKRVLGTVPVEADGSARFRVPANTPISLQPLDAAGRAIQLMRSWMTAMPGETVQCTGCHDRPNAAPPTHSLLAFTKPPSEIAPWRGPTRGFSYAREVQPVIDRLCVGCHDGRTTSTGTSVADLRGTVALTNWSSVTPGNGGYAHTAGKFSVGYAELHRYVRRPGIESDYHVLEPMEFHASTTHLVQLLEQGHHGVTLSAEDWDRLNTWIDLNCPYHGTWGEQIASPGTQRTRRRELLRRYGNLDDDPEAVPTLSTALAASVPQASVEGRPDPQPSSVNVPGWPFDASEAHRRQSAEGPNFRRSVGLAPGVALEFVRIPAGEFLTDEPRPRKRRIERSFWMATRELSNAEFAAFDPAHDSRVEDKNTYQFGIHGYPANQPEQPVVRVSFNEAVAFANWLTQRTGRRFNLPTETQWEWACRAGAATPFSFGPLGTDFTRFANLADAKLREFASDPYTVDRPLPDATRFDDWIPKEVRFNDGALLAVASGRYQPNAWGLHDLHGNVAEWTRPDEAPLSSAQKVAARGGSWRDTPARCTAGSRVEYTPWQHVYNVGIRLVCEEDPRPAETAAVKTHSF